MLPKTFILQAAQKFNLSDRELEVLTRALEGESVQDLAQELGVTKAALQKRLGEVYNKFDIGGGRGPGKLARLQQLLMEEYQKHTSQQSTPSTRPSTIDWGNTPHPQPIYGRQSELQQLQEIILTKTPSVVGIWGMPGIGKTALGVRLLQHLAPEFQQGIWRDFSHLNEIIPTLTPQTLLIIDNWKGNKTSLKPLKAGCVVLLSRTPLGEAAEETLHLQGLSDDAVRLWVEQQGLSPDNSQLQELSHPYGNHPLALNLLLQTIQDDWEGNITAFLKQNTLALANLIESYLKKHHSPLSETSRKILTALALQTQPLTLTDIQRYFTSLDELQELPEIVQDLAAKTLLKKDPSETYTLHPNLRNPITQIFIAKQLNQRGYKHYCQGNLHTAKQYLLQSLDYQNDFPHAHYNLGSTYEQLGEIDAAREQYQLAANSHSKATHAAISNLSRLEILEGNIQAAIEQILAILPQVSKTGIQASLYKNLGWAYLIQNDYKTALTYLQTALELDEKKATTHFLYAQTLEALNQLTEAQTYWQNGLNHLPPQSQFGITWRPPELIAWRVLAYQRLQTVSSSKSKKS